MAKVYAGLVGAVLLLVGLVGYFKTDLMGLHFNNTHNIIHIASGALGLIAAMAGGAKLYARLFGLIYTIVGIAGFVGVAKLVAMLDLNTMYNCIHLAVGLLGLIAGFVGGAEKAKAAGA